MLTGVILAGGRDTQINGIHKSLLPIGGETIIERQIRVMKSICSEVMIVTDEPMRYLPIVDRDVRIITDFVTDSGPVGGMHAALSLSTLNRIWVVGCEMPYISAPAVKLMLSMGGYSAWDAIVPIIGGDYEMLHGIYLKRCLNVVCTLLEKGKLELKHLRELLNVYPIPETVFLENGISSGFSKRVNSTEDYQKASERLSNRTECPSQTIVAEPQKESQL